MTDELRDEVIARIGRALCADDAPRVRELLDAHPELKARINEAVAGFDSPVILHARSRAMLDVLVDAGADIDAKSSWWAGGFGLLDTAEPDLAAYAIERGAFVGIHAAARFGSVQRIAELLRADASLVHARGGDGQTPLHFAGTAEAAAYLLDHGADIEARDIDHESTPAQYMVRERQPVLRYLIERGCRTDLLMAAALGDSALVLEHLSRDPSCIRLRVSDEHFPIVGKQKGGTIYQWTLGWYVSPHDVARSFAHAAVAELLLEKSPVDVRLLDACWRDDEATVDDLLAGHPDLIGALPRAVLQHVAHAARNDNLPAVKRMLATGFPVDATSQHGATPLHWAAFHGNAAMVRSLLGHAPPLEQRDDDFGGTPLGWAVHGSENGWHRERGQYGTTVELLIEAGAAVPSSMEGTAEVRAVLRRHGVAG